MRTAGVRQPTAEAGGGTPNTSRESLDQRLARGEISHVGYGSTRALLNYRRDVVVDDLTFTVQPGRVTGFLGPNGAGKSTAIKVLLDLADGLDPQKIRWLRDLLRERAAAGGTVFVSSHLLTEVEHLADEIVVLNTVSRLPPDPSLLCNKQVPRSVPRTRAGSPSSCRAPERASAAAPQMSSSSGASTSPISGTLPAAPVSPCTILTYRSPPDDHHAEGHSRGDAEAQHHEADVGLWAALGVIIIWALVPAVAGLVAVRRRDVV